MQQAVIITGLSNGDEAKGQTTDYLTRTHNAHTIIRYNGGSQAAHNVVMPDGRHHTFAQFGSGIFTPGTRTYLSRFMLVDPLAMAKEESHLWQVGIKDAYKRMVIDRSALVITPFQQAMNRLREVARNNGRHGSCGKGIGETMSDFLAYGRTCVPVVGDLKDSFTLMRKLKQMQQRKREEAESLKNSLPDTDRVFRELDVLTDPWYVDYCYGHYSIFADLVSIVDDEYLAGLLAQDGMVVFEGAQGVLLDETYGFHPYTTWSTTSAHNALTLLEEVNYEGEVRRIGLVRAYATRHGAGPFVTEDASLTSTIPDTHNDLNDWQQAFRVGYFDVVATRYALKISPADSLAINHLDRLAAIPEWKICIGYHVKEGSECFFQMQNGVATQIRINPKTDLVYQELLGKALAASTPEYITFRRTGSFETDVRGYVQLLSEQLGVSFSIFSFGPTAHDRRHIL